MQATKDVLGSDLEIGVTVCAGSWQNCLPEFAGGRCMMVRSAWLLSLMLAISLGCDRGLAQAKQSAKAAPQGVHSATAPTSGQGKPVFGGSYDKLNPEQRKLIDDWIAAYNVRTGKSLTPEAAYNAVPISIRTTFEAVTHALLTTKLTNRNKQPLGTALDIIESVETVKGKVPGARGDLQFRVYVTLRPNAIQLLDDSTQFSRKGDNTVFHYGYPVNMRQNGGFPSIQVSTSRDGKRGDIDVDYRSAGFPAGLVNGHLTAANSDVRAGSNYGKHNKRWSGLGNWWRNVFGIPIEDDSTWVPPAETDIAGKPAMDAGVPVEMAVSDFFSKWLVEKKPNLAVGYFSPRAYACFESGAFAPTPTQPVPRKLWNAMEETDYLVGRPSKLSEAISAVDLETIALTPLTQDGASSFTLAKLPLDLARKFDCASSGAPELQAGEYYAVAFRMKVAAASTGSDLFVWQKQGAYWRIIAVQNDIELLNPDSVPQVTPAEVASATVAPAAQPDPQMVQRQVDFLKALFVDKNSGAAFGFFSPSAYSCINIFLGSNGHKANSPAEAAQDLREDLRLIAQRALKGASIEEVIEQFLPDNPTLARVAHPNESAYLLAQIPNDEAGSLFCESGGAAKGASSATKVAGPYFGTFLKLIEPGDDTPGLGLLWAKRERVWKIAAYGLDEP